MDITTSFVNKYQKSSNILIDQISASHQWSWGCKTQNHRFRRRVSCQEVMFRHHVVAQREQWCHTLVIWCVGRYSNVAIIISGGLSWQLQLGHSFCWSPWRVYWYWKLLSPSIWKDVMNSTGSLLLMMGHTLSTMFIGLVTFCDNQMTTLTIVSVWPINNYKQETTSLQITKPLEWCSSGSLTDGGYSKTVSVGKTRWLL